MKYLLLLFGPTVMIFVGLQLIENVPITFLLFYSWLLVSAVYMFKRVKKDPIWSYQKTSVSIGVWSGILFFSVIFGCFYLLQGLLLDIPYLKELLARWGFGGKGLIGLVLIFLVINPILEELYWRGAMHNLLKEKVGAFLTILITSFFYSLYHYLSLVELISWPVNLLTVFPVFIVGLFWGYIKNKYNSIVGPIISHMLADMGIISVYWFFIH